MSAPDDLVMAGLLCDADREARLLIKAAARIQSDASIIQGLRAELEEANAENSRWLFRFADIREASGVGVKPMLTELPDAIKAEMDELRARVAELEARAGEAEAENARLLNAFDGLDLIPDDGEGDHGLFPQAEIPTAPASHETTHGRKP